MHGKKCFLPWYTSYLQIYMIHEGSSIWDTKIILTNHTPGTVYTLTLPLMYLLNIFEK